MPNSDAKSAWRWAEKVRVSIEDEVFYTEEGSTSVTASFGVACSESSPELCDPPSLLNAADKALYLAKQNRNQAATFAPITLASGQFIPCVSTSL